MIITFHDIHFTIIIVGLYHSLKITFKSKSYHTMVIHIQQQRLHHYKPLCIGMKPGMLGVNELCMLSVVEINWPINNQAN